MNKLPGKGYFIWHVSETQNGDIGRIAIAAEDAGLGHVLIKIADGAVGYNGDLRPLVETLQRKGIEVWGWHYIYGYPASEARMAVRRIRESGVTGFVVNAEVEFKKPGMGAIARAYMQALRAEVGPDFPIALSTYRYPEYHREFPFTAFLEYCDFNMPQVYWLLKHNPVEQLDECIRQYQALSVVRPMIPTGPAWKQGSWLPAPGELVAFMDAARDRGLEAANFWAWEHAQNLPGLWQAIADYHWQVEQPAPPDPEPPIPPIEIPEDELDTKKLDELLAKYPNAQLNINVSVSVDGEQAPAPLPGDPVPSGKDYRVVVLDKPSKRAKLRATANASVGEIDYVYDGDILTGPGRIVGEFTYITARVGGKPLVGPGFVETAYLVPLA